jgi:hypothetical protein
LGGQTVSWPIAGVSIFVPKYQYYASPEEIEKSNGGLFRMHGHTGFSVGTFHEFLVGELPTHMAFKMGAIELSFGEATPLAAYIFDFVHREKYFGEWATIQSARIVGATPDQAEIAFINGCMHYFELTGQLPTPVSMNVDFLFDEAEEAPEPDLKITSPPFGDVEPLRFYYHGLSQTDGVSASIYFFRVLEYYSFLTNQAKLAVLRQDQSLSTNEFAKRILELLTKDEKGPLLKLVVQLADEALLARAVSQGVIQHSNASQLGETLHSFRNSIVHGKFSHGYELQSSPVVGEAVGISAKRDLLQKLSLKAIQSFGSKLL